MFLERVFGETTPMQLTLQKHFCAPLLWTEHAFYMKTFFQGFSSADKISTIIVGFPKKSRVPQYFRQKLLRRGRKFSAGKLQQEC